MWEPHVPKFTFHVNLDERGLYFADVRNVNGRTVFKIKAGYGEDEDTVDSETEFMNNGLSAAARRRVDVEKLRRYLVNIGILSDKAKLTRGYATD